MEEPRAVLRCKFCGKVFKRYIGPKTFEIACPKCKETDIDYLGIEK